MFTTSMRCLFHIAGLLVILGGPAVSAQERSRDSGLLQRQSLERFKEGDYRSALAGYKALMEDFPDDAMYRYYSGICRVELNQELDEAIEDLYGASNSHVPSDVNYYLARAYQLDYNFTDALKYFGRFELQASRQEIRDYDLKRLISTCRSAREITTSYNPYEVLNVTFINLLDSVQFSQIRTKGGALQRKPKEYFTADESRTDLNSLMFMPAASARGDYVYFSGYTKSGKSGNQLFRVKKGTARTWGDPEEIKALNSDGDEIMPYFDPIESDLYFASDGRPGVGGFDLFRSHYDSRRDEWSEPINLGFPINSVMDEYLLLPGSDLGMVMFFSTRQGTDSTVTVYRVHLAEPKKSTIPDDNRMLKEIANMGDVAEEILAEIESIKVPDQRPGSSGGGDGLAAAGKGGGPPVITPVRIVNENDELSAYQAALAEALGHQSHSDSLKDLATAARIRVRESDDPNDRWVWQKQIMVWEKKARDEEAKADALYARISQDQVETSKASNPAVNVPETIEVDTRMGDMTIYRYSDPLKEIEGEPGTVPSLDQPEPGVQAPLNRFDILANSPYSSANPIPMDVELPGGAFYRIQLGAFGKPVDPDAFRGISPITGEWIHDRGLVKYYAGKFSRYDDASTALARIRSAGYEDAFVVAWYNGSPVSTQRAKQLE